MLVLGNVLDSLDHIWKIINSRGRARWSHKMLELMIDWRVYAGVWGKEGAMSNGMRARFESRGIKPAMMII